MPFRETITTEAEAEGKYKKQTGGHGQFGVAFLRVEPLDRGQGFEFVDKIVGGAIPRQFIPAVEKGVAEAMSTGGVYGFPVVDVRATVFDGKFHSVDSSEMSFKMAGSLGFRAAVAASRWSTTTTTRCRRTWSTRSSRRGKKRPQRRESVPACPHAEGALRRVRVRVRGRVTRGGGREAALIRTPVPRPADPVPRRRGRRRHPAPAPRRGRVVGARVRGPRSEEHTSELQSPYDSVCR